MNAGTHNLDREGLRVRLIGVLVAILVVSVVAVGGTAVATFDRAVEPELTNRTRLIGSIVRSEVQRALELGIPFESIVGLDRYLTETLEKFEEVDRIAVTTVSGQAIAVAERPSAPTVIEDVSLGNVIEFSQAAFALPVVEGNSLVGRITVETNPLFVQTRLREVFLDVVVIALVATLVALELALALTVTSVGKPLERVLSLLGEQSEGNFLHRIRSGGLGALGRTAERLNDRAQDLAERLAALPAVARARFDSIALMKVADGPPMRLRLSDVSDIRLALFLFSVATEIAAAFLPLYARAASRPQWLSPELAAAAPLMFYLIVVAVLSPFGGALVRRFGARRLFLASVPPAVLSLVALAFSDSLLGVTVWRGVVAVFYATATIACQEYAIRAAAAHGDTRPVGTFIAVLYAGVFCGSALGGVLAGRFGYEVAFVAGAAIAVLSGVMGSVAMHGSAGDPAASLAPSRDATVRQFRLRPRFLALLLGVAVPMNAATAVFVWYLTPLTLAALGSDPAEIARVVMLYYLAVILLGPMVTYFSDRHVGPFILVVCGALASGAALLSLTVWSGFWTVVAAVAGLGLGHTLMRAPLYVLALSVTERSGSGLGALRLVERFGAIIGLGASAVALGDVGGESSVMALGVITLIGIVVYAAIEVAERSRTA
jgi:predicted MFS family arabinose efflux permease